ncbi:MAG: hypothetical protein ACRD9W_13340, partial [Terriglobia bacterium]
MQALLDECPHFVGIVHIIGVKPGGRKVGFHRIARDLVDLVRDKVAVVVGLGNPLPQKLRQVDVGKRGHQGQHHPADGEHEFGLEPETHGMFRA